MNDVISIMEEICDTLEGLPVFEGNTQENSNCIYVKKLNASESLKLIEEAYGLMTSLFEVSDEQGVEVEEDPDEQNKIKREVKDKKGNKTQVVSVADELFPYEGNAKEQFNQKVIAKINDMIEGKATLEDLMQLVRQKRVPKKIKESFDGSFQAAVNKLNLVLNERRYSKAELGEIAILVKPSREKQLEEAYKKFDEVLSRIPNNDIAKQDLTALQQGRLNKADKEVARAQSKVEHVNDVINNVNK